MNNAEISDIIYSNYVVILNLEPTHLETKLSLFSRKILPNSVAIGKISVLAWWSRWIWELQSWRDLQRVSLIYRIVKELLCYDYELILDKSKHVYYDSGNGG